MAQHDSYLVPLQGRPPGVRGLGAWQAFAADGVPDRRAPRGGFHARCGGVCARGSGFGGWRGGPAAQGPLDLLGLPRGKVVCDDDIFFHFSRLFPFFSFVFFCFSVSRVSSIRPSSATNLTQLLCLRREKHDVLCVPCAAVVSMLLLSWQNTEGLLRSCCWRERLYACDSVGNTLLVGSVA